MINDEDQSIAPRALRAIEQDKAAYIVTANQVLGWYTVYYLTGDVTAGSHLPLASLYDGGHGVAGYLSAEDSRLLKDAILTNGFPPYLPVIVGLSRFPEEQFVVVIDYVSGIPDGNVPVCSEADLNRYCRGNPAFVRICRELGAGHSVLVRKPDSQVCRCGCSNL